MSTTSNRFSNNSGPSETSPYFDLIDKAHYRSARSEPGFSRQVQDTKSEVQFGEDAGDYKNRHIKSVESVFREKSILGAADRSEAPVPSVRSSVAKRSEMSADKKLEMQAMMVRDLKIWNAKGNMSSRKYDMYSSFEDVRREHAYVKACREKENSIRKYKEYILAFATGATYLNDSVKPVQNFTKVSMKPWLEEFDFSVSEEGMLDVELEALYEKYKHMPSIPPEVSIPFAIAKSFVKSMLVQRRELAKQEERINSRTDTKLLETENRMRAEYDEREKLFQEKMLAQIASSRVSNSYASSSISSTTNEDEVDEVEPIEDIKHEKNKEIENDVGDEIKQLTDEL